MHLLNVNVNVIFAQTIPFSYLVKPGRDISMLASKIYYLADDTPLSPVVLFSKNLYVISLCQRVFADQTTVKHYNNNNLIKLLSRQCMGTVKD